MIIKIFLWIYFFIFDFLNRELDILFLFNTFIDFEQVFIVSCHTLNLVCEILGFFLNCHNEILATSQSLLVQQVKKLSSTHRWQNWRSAKDWNITFCIMTFISAVSSFRLKMIPAVYRQCLIGIYLIWSHSIKETAWHHHSIWTIVHHKLCHYSFVLRVVFTLWLYWRLERFVLLLIIFILTCVFKIIFFYRV